MRLLFVNPVAGMGGAEWSLLELTGALKEEVADLTVACPPGALAQRLLQADIAVHSLPQLRLPRPRPLRPASWLPWLALPGARRALRRIAGAVRPDIVHANSLTAMLTAAPLRAGAPLVWHVRDLALQPAAARWAARRARVMVAISPAVEERLRAILPAALHGRVRRVDNGISLARFDNLPERALARRQLQLPTAGPLAGMLAHLTPWKRHDLFLEAAALTARAMPMAHFVIAGRDLCGEHAGYRRRLEAMAARPELRGRVHWLEDVDDAPLFLRSLDLLVHPAGAEPFGRVLCESMAAGTAVVAIAAAGPAAIVAHGVSGWLTAPGDAAELAGAMCALLGDAGLRARLEGAAAARVRAAFDIRRGAGALAGLFRELAPGSMPSTAN